MAKKKVEIKLKNCNGKKCWWKNIENLKKKHRKCAILPKKEKYNCVLMRFLNA